MALFDASRWLKNYENFSHHNSTGAHWTLQLLPKATHNTKRIIQLNERPRSSTEQNPYSTRSSPLDPVRLPVRVDASQVQLFVRPHE